MAGQQVQMVPGTGPEPKMKVYYEGTDTILNGYLLCSNTDYTADAKTLGMLSVAAIAAATPARERYTRVEKPKIGNVHRFVGAVVGLGEAGRKGPCELDVAWPANAMADLYTDASCTIDTTVLFLQVGSYLAGASGVRRIGLAANTIDRSSTSGLVLAWLEPPDQLVAGTGGQEINSSTTFTAAIWDYFPVAEMRRNPNLGTFIEYDPTFKIDSQIPERAEYTGSHNSVAETHVAATTMAAIERNLVLSQDASAADNDGVSVQFPGPVVISGGKPWAFEVDFDVATVTDTDINTFIGLHEAATLANGIPFQDGAAYATASDLIGFDIKASDGNSLDVIYKAGGDTVVAHQAGAGVPTAAAAITVAMHYNGTTIQPYVDGTAKTVISEDDIADITTDTFPAGVTAYLTAAVKADSGVADGDDLSIRAFRVIQMA